jgi:hypothetical protein
LSLISQLRITIIMLNLKVVAALELNRGSSDRLTQA